MDLSKRMSRIFKKNFKAKSLDEFVTSLEQMSVEERKSTLEQYVGLCDKTFDAQETRVQQAERSLEISSRELTESNKVLFNLNRTLDAILNNLNEGLVVFDQAAECEPIGSSAAEKHFGCDFKSGDKKFTELYLGDEHKDSSSISGWIDIIFSGSFAFEDMAPLGPSGFVNKEGRNISLDYRPIMDNEGKVAHVICISKDITEELETMKELADQKSKANFILDLSENPKTFFDTYEQIDYLLVDLEKLSKSTNSDSSAETLKKTGLRILHTLKGAYAMIHMDRLVSEIHEFENALSENTQSPDLRKTLGQSYEACLSFQKNFEEKHGKILNIFRDSDTIQTSRKDLADFWSKIEMETTCPPTLKAEFKNLLFLTDFKNMLCKYDQSVQKLAKSYGKNIAPAEFVGDKIMISEKMYAEFIGSLVHVFRNIAAHGIESPDERELAGKSLEGQVTVSTTQINDQFLELQISDDGKGIDPKVVRNIAATKGLNQFQDLHDSELIQVLFESGFSTKTDADELSGRGVGLEAVKQSLLDIGGDCYVRSTLGKGTTFVFKVPIFNSVAVVNESMSLERQAS